MSEPSSAPSKRAAADPSMAAGKGFPEGSSEEGFPEKGFPETDRLDLPSLERTLLDWWDEHDIFEESVARREGAPAFTFYEGPPTANGRPGIHHVMARAIKDLFCRYKTMQGFRVERKAGWDTHGLPVEIEVEKELGLQTREDVLDYGINRYNDACRESVLRYKDLWDELTRRMGYWVDLDNPYVTYETDYVETVWWLLKQIYEKDLLYKGYKIQWYSPGSGTVLSSHEVSLGYEEVQDPSVYVRFPVEGEEDTFFLAWTTTPWTLISNTALAVGTGIEYVKVRHEDPHQGTEYLILAEDQLEVLQEEVEVVEHFAGRELLGQTYRPIFSYFSDEVGEEAAWRVVEAGFVSTEEGTGVVHMAPAFGADDYTVGQREDLPFFCPVDLDGRFTEQAPLVEGQWFKDADKDITDDLKQRGLLYRHETYVHNYPHDWRKGTPLMSYPVESWFIKTTDLKDRMVELNKTIGWQPEGVGTGRFGEWLEGNVDWALSRRRYWGTPLPVWENDNPDSDYVEVIGSIEELRAKCPDQLPDSDAEIDLHRPFVDGLTWPAPEAEGGGTMKRVPDLIDVWFDSGAMPFAQWHYPFENEVRFERNFPADFIAEGVDQTRGWFYTLHAIATIIMGEVAYKNVVVNGLVLDEKGAKMSKSKGNAVEPFEVISEYGADTVRWYLMSNTPPWENLKFSERGLQNTRRKFFSTLGNIYSFFATYANIDGFRFLEERLPVSERPELDRWILSRLHSTVAAVEEAFDSYDPTSAARAVEAFVEDLSNWHIRRSRRRFWAAKKEGGEGEKERGRAAGDGAERKGDPPPDPSKDATCRVPSRKGTRHRAPTSRSAKTSAYQTVYECLTAVARLMAPIAPFFGEWLYRSLIKNVEAQPVASESAAGPESTSGAAPASVHLTRFPAVRTEEVDEDLEYRMGLARSISSAALSLRNEAQINVRQPLPRILVVADDGVEAAVEEMRSVILDEINVKDIDYITGSSGVVRRSAKPNFQRLGPRLGSLMQPTHQAVRQLTDEDIERYQHEGELALRVDGETITLGPEDLQITSEGIEGWLVGQEGGITVALDTEITDDLRAEGLAREAVKRIQNLRKDAGFEVTDRIEVEYAGSESVTRALDEHVDYVRNETLSVRLQKAPEPAGAAQQTFTFGGETLTLGVRRVPRSGSAS